MFPLLSVGFVSCGNDDDSKSNDEDYADVIEKDGYLQVNVKTAGSFEELIGNTRKYQTGKLKVSGFLNGDDIRCIRDMMITSKGGRLEYLDMADASIVEGGGSYYIHDNSDKYDDECYKTKNNFISESMFEECDAIQKLILPNSVVRISHYMFGYGFGSNIRSITIGRSTVGSIDHEDTEDVLGVLAWMDKLEEINVHPGNPNFTSDDGIMYNKDKSKLLNVPPLYKGNLSFPNSLQIIARCAFRGYAASAIKLPDSVKKLEDRAFWSSEFKTINTGSVSEIGFDVFMDCDKTEEIILSESISWIPDDTFRGCKALTDITLPKSIGLIGRYAFHSCDNLRNIYMESSNPPSTSSDVQSCKDVFTFIPYESINLYVPQGSKPKYASAIPWSGLNIIEY